MYRDRAVSYTHLDVYKRQNVEFPLGEGLLHFLYTDFETACDPEQITFEQEQEMRPASFESETEQKVLITCALPKQLSIFAL